MPVNYMVVSKRGVLITSSCTVLQRATELRGSGCRALSATMSSLEAAAVTTPPPASSTPPPTPPATRGRPGVPTSSEPGQLTALLKVEFSTYS